MARVSATRPLSAPLALLVAALLLGAAVGSKAVGGHAPGGGRGRACCCCLQCGLRACQAKPWGAGPAVFHCNRAQQLWPIALINAATLRIYQLQTTQACLASEAPGTPAGCQAAAQEQEQAPSNSQPKAGAVSCCASRFGHGRWQSSGGGGAAAGMQARPPAARRCPRAACKATSKGRLSASMPSSCHAHCPRRCAPACSTREHFRMSCTPTATPPAWQLGTMVTNTGCWMAW